MDQMANNGNQQNTGASVKSWASRLDERKKQLRLDAVQQQQNERFNTSLNLDDGGLRATAKDLEDSYYVASRGEQLAGMIVDYGLSRGKTITGSSTDIINTYLQGNKAKGLDRSVDFYNYTHGTEDSESFKRRMGWTDEPTGWEQLEDWFVDVSQNLVWGERMAGKGVRDLIYSFQTNDLSPDDEQKKFINAFYEYTFSKYGSLNDENFEKAEWDVRQDPNVLSDFIGGQVPLNAILELGMGGLASFASLTPWGFIINGMLSAGAELPVGRDIVGGLGAVFDFVGGLPVDLVTLIAPEGEVASLPEDTRNALNQFLGGYMFGKFLTKRNANTGKIEARQWVKDTLGSITPQWLMNQIRKIGGGDGGDTGAGGQRVPSLKELQRERSNSVEQRKLNAAARIGDVNSKNAWDERDIVNRSLERLGKNKTKGVKTTEDLWDVLENSNEMYRERKQGILSMDTRLYKPGDSIYTRTLTDPQSGITSRPQTIDVFGNGIKQLRRVFRYNRDILQTLDIIEQKRKTTGLRRTDADILAKMIAQGAKLYERGTSDMLTADYVKELEQARRDLKEWSRMPFKDTVPEVYEALEYIDGAESDNLNTQALLEKSMNKKISYEGDSPRQNEWQRGTNFIVRTLRSKGKNILDYFLNNKGYNPITRERDLRSNLKDFYKQDGKISRSNYEQLIEDWYNENVSNSEPTSEYVGEGEVVYPKRGTWHDVNNYLEDIVRVVEDIESPSSQPGALGNNSTRLQSQLKSLGLSEEQIGKVEEVMKTVVQESLFGDEIAEATSGKKSTKGNKK